MIVDRYGTHIPPVLQPIPWECEYVSPAELQRRERVAVGRICRCRKCVCCQELARDRAVCKHAHAN